MPDQPEGAVASDGLVGRQGEPGEGQDFRGIDNTAIVGVVSDPEQFLEAVVIQRQLPAMGQFRKLVAETRLLAIQITARGERKGRGLDVRGQVDSASVLTEGGEIGEGLDPRSSMARR